MTFRPWIKGPNMKTRHCFYECAYWFVVGILWQVDRLIVTTYPNRLLDVLLPWLSWHLDSLRMSIAGYCFPFYERKGADHAA